MSRRWPARRVRLRWCRYQPASGGLPQLARRTLLPGSNPEGRPTLRLQGRSLYATCRLNGPFGSPRSSIALDVTRRAGLAFAHGKICASHCIGLPGNGGVKHWGLNFRSTSRQLAALIQQRIRHAYRRQRPTPPRAARLAKKATGRLKPIVWSLGSAEAEVHTLQGRARLPLARCG
jgi:hypothetical protein